MGASWSNWEDIASGKTLHSAIARARRRLAEMGKETHLFKLRTAPHQHDYYLKIDGHWYRVVPFHSVAEDGRESDRVHITLQYRSIYPSEWNTY
jgi:hypothetical protein